MSSLAIACSLACAVLQGPGDTVVHGDTTFEVVATVPLPRNPHGAAFSTDGKRAYIACAGDDAVVEFDMSSLEVVGRKAVPGTPLDVALAPDGESLLVTQFSLDSLAQLPLDGTAAVPISTPGEGPSLFSRPGKRGARYLVSERADTVSEIAPDGTVGRTWPTASRPYPADVTSDGILLFVPNRDGNSVTIIDTLNNTVVATTGVPDAPEGGAVTLDDVNYVVACGGADKLAFINTASFEVIDEIEGVGPRPFSVTMSLDGRYALVNNAGGDTVSVLDVSAREIVGQLRVGRTPIVVRAHPDGEHFLVMCEGDHHVAVIRMTRKAEPIAKEPTIVAVMGMIHSGHRTSERYGLDMVRAIIEGFRPDDICVELPPNRFEATMQQWHRDGRVTESRTRVFPEYVDVVLPMLDAAGFTIIPTAGWTKEMNDFRRTRMREIAQDPGRKEQWEVYEQSMDAMQEQLAALGPADDPFIIHSDAYDRISSAGYGGPYNRLFNDDLEDGGWDHINEKHYANIARHLDRVAGQGRRVLITYGAAHKPWFLAQLRRRDDVVLVDLTPFIKDAQRVVADRAGDDGKP
jgi:YVTN family beta-propeller protein